jgi:beta-N-acetylhexosaminidase
MEHLARPPFSLDAEALAWVRSTYAALSTREKTEQLLVLISAPWRPESGELIRRFAPGGITRFFGADLDEELAFIGDLRNRSKVPPFITADLEGSRLSFAFSTPLLNPLGLAAVDDLEATEAATRIMAEEAAAVGVNWTFTPVVDINAAFRSAIVATRGFGDNVDRIERHALKQIEVFQRHGIAATVKHWPGEGFDDRDQHLVTTINPLSLEDWERTFGRLYRAAIRAGVMSVMSAHIALPSYIRSLDPEAGVEAFRPASVSRALTHTLLRERLGFNGLIVSDATGMAGLGAYMDRRIAGPALLEAGCDVILFPPDPETDIREIESALDSGKLPGDRFEDAVTRVLGLKAALGLHRPDTRTNAERKAALGHKDNLSASKAITARAPTLVKDTQGLLPLDPKKHRRVLVISPGILHPLEAEPRPFVLPNLLKSEGFEITEDRADIMPGPGDFDLILYLFGDETVLTRGRIFIDWAKLGGNLMKSMHRPWFHTPTLMISFGYPYMLYDAPRTPTYINAYSTLDSVQRAVLECLMGRAPFLGRSPVDPFCGLEDARY